MYEKRFYRSWSEEKGLISFNVCVKETDLMIFAQTNLSPQAEISIKKYRKQIENYIKNNPDFLTSLTPLSQGTGDYPNIIKTMIDESALVNVGPMASVAGAISEFVGKDLLKDSEEIIVENGGDIFLKTKNNKIIGLYSGNDSKFNKNIGIKISPEQTPIGICTSSGKIGHSLSFGQSDAVVVLSKSTAMADALATKIGNHIKSPDNINKGIEIARQFKGVEGIVIACQDKIGFWGNIQIIKTK